MSTFTENPMFLIFDELVSGNSPNFASDGKIVELFDTGCDARTPGGTFKKTMEPDTASNTPDVQKPFRHSKGDDKTPVMRKSSGDQSKNIGAARKSLTQLNSLKDKLPCTKSNGFAIKPALVGKKNVAKGSNYSGRVSPADESRAEETPPGQYRARETGPKIRSTFGSRARTSPTTPSTRTSNITSEATFNHGLKKCVNRAVDKDSLSNCSRQLETAKTFGQASRLPRSYVAAKNQPKVTPLTKTEIGSGGTALTKMMGTIDQESLKRTTKANSDSRTPKLSTKQPNIKNRGVLMGSKIAPSRVPLSRFSSRNLSTKSAVKPPVNGAERSKELVKAPKSIEKVSSNVQRGESALDNKLSTIGRPPKYPEKVPARPSAKCHDLTPRDSEARNSTISFQTRLPRPRNPLIVPKLMTFMKNGVSRYSTESNPKPHSAFGTMRRFSDRRNVVLSSKIPTSVSLSGVQGVDEWDDEIELKTVFEDTSVTKKKPMVKSSNALVSNKINKEPKVESKVPRPVITKRFPVREMGRISSARNPRGPLKNTVKKGAKKESAEPSTIKSTGNIPEAKNIPEALEIVEKEDDDEVVIPIMNPALCNMSSFATQYRNKSILEKTSPQESVHGKRIESWIDGHEQAYLKGRAIGLKVASMARAAKEEPMGEFLRIGSKNITPIPTSRLDKSQEIVDIGVSVIERVLAEKDSGIRSPSVREDRAPQFLDFDKNTKWNSRQWI